MTIKKLQNGSDIRGVALKIPGGEDVNLGKIEAVKIATAFAEWLKINENRNRHGLTSDRALFKEIFFRNFCFSGHLCIGLRPRFHPCHVHVYCIR